MANKIIETNLPAEVIAEIDRHLTKAETKHPFFAASILPYKLCNPQSVESLLKKPVKNVKRHIASTMY